MAVACAPTRWRRRAVACSRLLVLLSSGADVCVPKQEHACLGNGFNVAQRLWDQNPFDALPIKFYERDAKPHIVDWDNDADLDVVVGTSSGWLYYFENVSSSQFLDRSLSESTNPFYYIRGVGPLVPQAVDWDGDGYLDLLLGDGSGNVRYYKRLPNDTLQEQIGQANPFDGIDAGGFGAAPHAVDWDSDGDLDLILGGGTYLQYYKRTSAKTLSVMNGSMGIEAPQNGIPWTVDWDGDGDLDLFVADLAGQMHYWERTDSGLVEHQVHALDGVTGLAPVQPQILDWNSDGHLDLVLGNADAALLYFEWEADLTHDERVGFGLNPFHAVDVGEQSALVAVDWDGDGDLDIVVGSYGGHLSYFEYLSCRLRELDKHDFQDIFVVGGQAVPAIADWDGDGDLDLFVGDLLGKVYYFERTHTGFKEAITFPDCQFTGGSASPHVVDWDGDGKLDLLVGTFNEGLWYFKGINTTTFEERHQLVLFNESYSLKPTSADVDGDGDLDLVVGESAGTIRYFERVSNTSIEERHGAANPFSDVPLTSQPSPEMADWDGDGDLDVILGRGDGMVGYYETGSCVVQPTCSGFGVCNYVDATCMCVGGYNGTPSCAACELGYQQDPRIDALSCVPCPLGTVSDGLDDKCRPCLSGSAPAETGAVCNACNPGTYAGLFDEACMPCAAGKYASGANSSSCEDCEAGRYSLSGSDLCRACDPGHTSDPGNATCWACLYGEVAQAGDSSCSACGPGFTPDADGARCVVDLLFVFVISAAAVLHALLLHPIFYHWCRKVRIEDITTVDGQRIVTAYGPHHILKGGTRISVVRLEGTGLRVEGRLFLALPIDGIRLELVLPEGEELERPMEASMGTIHKQWPMALMNTNLKASIGGRFPLLWLVPLFPLPWLPMLTRMYRATALALLVASLTAGLAAFIVRHRQWIGQTPVEHRLQKFTKKHLKSPRKTPPGPDRAVTVGNLTSLYNAFESLIRGRNAYYLNKNITKRITKDLQLSFAEAIGPARITFFVSHFWGTPFAELVSSIRHHAETASEPSGTPLSYWICFLSNNQWRLHEEVGEWNESSFYKALQSKWCAATCMVIDVQALPLTRSWCLFEVMLTLEKEAHDAKQGLLFCTSSGVMSTGTASYDASAALAEKLADLRVENATASKEADKRMIDSFVLARGGFRKMNVYLRQKATDAMGAETDRFVASFSRLTDSMSLFDLRVREGDDESERTGCESDPIAVQNYESV